MAQQPNTDLHALIEGYLARMEMAAKATDDGVYMLRYGSTAVVMRLIQDTVTDKRFVRFSAATLSDFDVTDVLLREVIRLNNEVLFGSFRLFEDHTLSFSTTILADHLDFEEFETALTYVLRISDEYDDILQALVGGNRATDLLGG
jgi:hypothetical protein